MAKYFSKFPTTDYSQINGGPEIKITDIMSRFAFENSLKDNAAAYNSYIVKDGDTPESLAHKFYGSSEYHWVILNMNNIIDPLNDWSFDSNTLLRYINDKYSSYVTSEKNGIEWAKSHIKTYYRVITRTYDNYTKTIYVEVDKDTYDWIGPTSQVILTSDNVSITENMTRTAKSYYTLECELNDSKRKIKVLKGEFVPSLLSELSSVLNG